MKKIIVITAVALFTSACSDSLLTMDPEWYLAGGNDQLTFRELTLTDKGLPGDIDGVEMVATTTVDSNRKIARTIVSAEGAKLCTGEAYLDGTDYQAFTALVAEAKLADYVPPTPETAPAEEGQPTACAAIGTPDIAISYLRSDGEDVAIDNPDDDCPASEAILAVIDRVNDLAMNAFPECTAEAAAAAAAASAEESAAEEAPEHGDDPEADEAKAEGAEADDGVEE